MGKLAISLCIMASIFALLDAMAIPGKNPYFRYPRYLRRVPWGKNLERVYVVPSPAKVILALEPPTVAMKLPEKIVPEGVSEADSEVLEQVKEGCNCPKCLAQKNSQLVKEVPQQAARSAFWGYNDYDYYNHYDFDYPYEYGYGGGYNNGGYGQPGFGGGFGFGGGYPGQGFGGGYGQYGGW